MSKFKPRYIESWKDISLYPDFPKWITPVVVISCWPVVLIVRVTP